MKIEKTLIAAAIACALGFPALASDPRPAGTPITQDELVRRAQELLDAVASGDRAPAKRYFAENCIFVDEVGHDMDKATLVAGLSALPPGFSGGIKVDKPESRIFGDTAVLSYDLDETEAVFGQKLSARYHETDTWRLRSGKWQIIAAQVLRYYEDPTPAIADPGKYPDYTGVYQLAPGKALRVRVENGGLVIARDDSRTPLFLESGDLFFARGVEGRCLFRRNASGAVDALVKRRNNEDIVWARQ
jgi:hypothetical protein